MQRPSFANQDLTKVLTKKVIEEKMRESYEDQEDNDLAKEIVIHHSLKERIAAMNLKIERAKKVQETAGLSELRTLSLPRHDPSEIVNLESASTRLKEKLSVLEAKQLKLQKKLDDLPSYVDR